jgi:RHS repeat-associated protein
MRVGALALVVSWLLAIGGCSPGAGHQSPAESDVPADAGPPGLELPAPDGSPKDPGGRDEPLALRDAPDLSGAEAAGETDSQLEAIGDRPSDLPSDDSIDVPPGEGIPPGGDALDDNPGADGAFPLLDSQSAPEATETSVPPQDSAEAGDAAIPGDESAAPSDLALPVVELTFTGIAGEWASAPQAVVPGNAGAGTLAWVAKADVPWLSVEPAQGEQGEELVISVILEAAPQQTGGFEASVTVENAADPADSELLKVKLETVGIAVGPFTTGIEYDDADRVTALIWPDGSQVSHSYELLDVPVQTTWPDGSTVTRTYDEAGRLLALAGPAGEMSFAWGNNGLPAQVLYPDGKSFGYSYDAAGRLVELEYPDGTAVKYAFDAAGLLISAKSPAGTISFQNDKWGRPMMRTWPGGLATSFEYDEAGKLVATQTNDAAGNLLVRYEQTFDERALRSTMTETTPFDTLTWDYAYDAVGRLQQVTGPEGTTTFQHDLAGRRTSIQSPGGTVEYAYDTDGRMIRAGDAVFRYDPRGRMTERLSPAGKTLLAFDPEDHLLSVQASSGLAQYEYAPDGARHTRSAADSAETLWQATIDGLPRPLYRQSSTEAGIQKTRFVHGPDWLLEERAGKPPRALIQDLLGNVARVVALDGTVEVTARFSPFGERLMGEYVIGYQGEEQDPLTGFVHLRARDYDPQLGIFLSKDTGVPRLTSPSALDRYVYAGGDPVNRTDHDGAEDKPKPNMDDIVGYIKDAVKKLELAGEHDLAVIAIISVDAGGADGEGIGFSWDFKNQQGEVSGQMDIPLVFIPEGRGITQEATWINGWLVQKLAPGVKTPFTQEWKFSVSDFFPSVKGDIKITVSGKIFSTKGLVQPVGYGNKGYLGGGPGPKGGVSLDQAAKVLGELGDISGAAWDAAAGQLVLFGPEKNVLLPPMSADDVVAAWRAVFQHPGDDPGVTIGTVPPPPGFAGEQGVAYFAGIENTHLGWSLFDADRALKSYIMGKDNVTGAPIVSQVPGYQSVLDRVAASAGGPAAIEHRLWFVPDSFTLAQAPGDPETMLFVESSMKLLTESKYLGQAAENPEAAAFAQHFTESFDLFALERPAFDEMRRAARIVSVLRWMRDEGIPLDREWFDRYELPEWETPLHTPTNSASTLSPGGQVVTISGGIDMGLANGYVEDPAAAAAAAVALAARPDEETQGWTFESGVGSLAAAAVSTAPVERAGYGFMAHRDVRSPGPGSIPFELVRYCSPFDVRATVFGFCWEPRPHSLRRTGPEKLMAWPGYPAGRLVPEAVSWVDRRGNREVAFAFAGKFGDRLLYLPQSSFGDSVYLEPNESWTLERRSGDVVSFRQDRVLTWEEDRSGNRVTYVHDDQSRLVAVQHSCGQEFSLAYDAEGRIVSVALPGGDTLDYGYDDAGDLATVDKSGLPPLGIAYDGNHLPVAMAGLGGTSAAAASFDFLGRLTSLGGPDGLAWEIAYADFGHSVTVTAPDGTQTERSFDQAGRLTSAVDPLGRETVLEYAPDLAAATTLVDPAGRTATFGYDDQGRLVEFESLEGNQTHVYFDEQSQPIGLVRSGLPDLFLVRDELGRIVKVCDHAKLQVDGEKVVAAQTGDSVVQLEYDASGEVVSVTAPGKAHWSMTRNERGQPVTTVSPSGMEEYRTYDDHGRVTEVSRPDGAWVQLDYDVTGRIDTVTTPDGTYHLLIDGKGQMLGIADPSGAASTMVRDESGQVVSVTHADGGTVEFVRDDLGRVTQASDATNYVMKLHYDAAGRMILVTTGQAK